MIDQLKEAAKGVDLNDLALDLERQFLERLNCLEPGEQVDVLLRMFSFLSVRAVWRAGEEIKEPALKVLYLLMALPAVGGDFKKRLVDAAAKIKRDLPR